MIFQYKGLLCSLHASEDRPDGSMPHNPDISHLNKTNNLVSEIGWSFGEGYQRFRRRDGT